MLKILIGLFVILIGHVLLLAFTNHSLVGYWTDFWIPLTLIVCILIILQKLKSKKMKPNRLGPILLGLISIPYLVLGIQQVRQLGGYQFFNSFKITAFHWIRIDETDYNAYFIRVGAATGGEGNFWITESNSIFPLLEETVYYKHAVLWDFSLEEWDGQAIDQEKIVRNYVETEIIDKKEHK